MPNIAPVNGIIINGAEAAVSTPSNPHTRLFTTGWDLIIIMGGWRIPNSYLIETLTLDAVEDNSTLCTFVVRPPAATVDIDFWSGKDVTVDVLESTGIRRIFTGVVDIPDIDITLETITLRCTNRIEERANDLLTTQVKTIGHYSTDIFSEPKDTAEELRQRMETIPFSFHFDAYGNFRLVPWQPKATADHTLSNSNVYYETPEVELTSRGRILNKIDIKFQYRYNRDYHLQRSFNWESPIAVDICNMLRDGMALTQRSLIQAAADSTGWPINGQIDFDPIPEAGWYKCGGATVAWSPISVGRSLSVKKDENGSDVHDAKGNKILVSDVSQLTDYRPVFTIGADWEATTRWTQTWTEEYTVTVQAPQSITQYSTVDSQQSFGLSDSYTSDGWEDYTIYTNLGLGSSYLVDRDIQRADFNNMFTVATNRARTSILKTHRENFVSFRRGIWTVLDLQDTISLTTSPVAAKGKVRKYRHFFNLATGEAYTSVEIALSRAQGSSSDTPLSIPATPDTSVTLPTGLITLGNHFGEDPFTASDSDTWTGMIGNKFVGGWKTQYQEQFIVVTPEIPDKLRASVDKTTASSYDVAIPNDSLTIVFDGKL